MSIGHSNIESQIIIYLLKQDKRAISLVYANYADALFGIISRIIPESEVATEVLQDTLLKIWKNSLKYDVTKGKLFTWMAQIARNSAIDTVRSGKYQRTTKTYSIPDTVSNSVELSETIQITDSGLKRQIDSLDKKYREVINLLYFMGYSQSEAAKKLNLPLGTVKTRARTAILELRKSLGNEVYLIPMLYFITTLIADLA
jgi:RNA polymerase sigma-70 factor (ECF subfamily)